MLNCFQEHLAVFVAGNEEREKIAPRSPYGARDDDAAINGLNWTVFIIIV